MLGAIFFLSTVQGAANSGEPRSPGGYGGPAPVIRTGERPDGPTNDLGPHRWDDPRIGGGSILYAGTADAGVVVSEDGGDHWVARNVGLATTKRVDGQVHPSIHGLVIDPTTPNILYAATSRGVFKTTDGGVSWRGANEGLPPGRLNQSAAEGDPSLFIDPAMPSTIYALFRFEPNSGVFRSTDGGATWQQLDLDLPALDPNRPRTSQPLRGLALDPSQPGVIYLNTTEFGLRRSTDGGAEWSSVPSNLDVGDLVIAPTAPTAFFGLNRGRIYRSTDGAAGWSDAGSEALAALIDGFDMAVGPVDKVVIDPRTPTTVYAVVRASLATTVTATTDGGIPRIVAISNDLGATWRIMPAGAILNYGFSLVVDTAQPPNLYAVSGQGAEVLVSDGGAAPWRPLHAMADIAAVLGDTNSAVDVIAVEPNNPDVVYHAREGGVFRSNDGGETWRVVLTFPTVPPITALAAVPGRPEVAYAAGAIASTREIRPGQSALAVRSQIYRTADAGATWYSTGAELPDAVGTLSVDAIDPRRVYARTTDSIYRTSDGGETWTTMPLPVPSDRSFAVDALELDRNTPGTIYVAINTADRGYPWYGGWVRADHCCSVAKSTDGGVTWQVLNEAPLGCSIFALAIHLTDRAVLYAGTACGVFLSHDGGLSWTSRRDGLPEQPADRPEDGAAVRRIAIDPLAPDTIYAGIDVRGYIIGGVGGLFKSTDGGGTWAPADEGLPAPRDLLLSVVSNPQYDPTGNPGAPWGLSKAAVRELVLDPRLPSRVYAVMEALSCFARGPCTRARALYLSRDGGETWLPPEEPIEVSTLAVGYR